MGELLNSIEIGKLEKMAELQYAGVSQVQIATVVGLSEGRVSQIMATAEYGKQVSEVEMANYEKMEQFNRGWDGVEDLAVATVLEHMQGVPDPDFALKAAVVANKAIRRGGNGNKPIQIQAGLQTVIELHANFVGQLQNNFNVAPRTTKDIERKSTNMLSVKGVHSMLGIAKDVEGFEVVQQDVNATEIESALVDL